MPRARAVIVAGRNLGGEEALAWEAAVQIATIRGPIILPAPRHAILSAFGTAASERGSLRAWPKLFGWADESAPRG